tara:strand:- start:78 stop:1556 length:1479 start_codon:yes stop_codon:yes gene_type:complete
MHEDDRISKFIPLMQSLYGAARENLGFEPHVKICIIKSRDNMQNPLGKTAFYSPSEHKIGLYTQGRHIKDILRSLAHELVHHNQNCRGDFDNGKETIQGYAQQDGHLREMEREAYERGNMIFRDWEDTLKNKGGKPLFTSTSQYVPPPTSDVVGFPLLEKNKMNRKLNEQGKPGAAAVASLAGQAIVAGAGGKKAKDKPKKGLPTKKEVSQFGRLKQAIEKVNPKAAKSMPNPTAYQGNCEKYDKLVADWVRKHNIEQNIATQVIRSCKETGGQQRVGSKTWNAFNDLVGGGLNVGVARQYFRREGPWRPERKLRGSGVVTTTGYAESKINKTNNSLFEGDKMKNKLTKRKLQKAIHEELIQELLEETTRGQFDKTKPATAAYETGKIGGKIVEDSGEEEAWNDWKNEHEDDNHIEEMEHHLRALKDDRDYERKGAEYDHDKYEDEGDDDRRDEQQQVTESFFPKGRSTRDKARNELNEGLMKRWGYTKKEK